VLTVEDWAEIRRLHRAEGMPVKGIARTLGISRNTVRSALASDGPPKYQRKPAGSAVDAFEPRIRELLQVYPTMPATVIAERVGWERGLTVLKDRVRELRPAYLPPDPASRTAYDPGELAQCDFWFPPVTVPVGFGQRPALPVTGRHALHHHWGVGVARQVQRDAPSDAPLVLPAEDQHLAASRQAQLAGPEQAILVAGEVGPPPEQAIRLTHRGGEPDSKALLYRVDVRRAVPVAVGQWRPPQRGELLDELPHTGRAAADRRDLGADVESRRHEPNPTNRPAPGLRTVADRPGCPAGTAAASGQAALLVVVAAAPPAPHRPGHQRWNACAGTKP
jgi:hypothetical protein